MRPHALSLMAIVIALCAAALGASRAAANTLDVTVEGLRSSRGQVLIGLHATASSFPSRWAEAVAVIRLPADLRPSVATFQDVPPGRYALVVVHDEDGDGEMSKTFIGFPREGFGASNNPTFLGPPRFGSASFALEGPMRTTIRIVYP